VDKACRKSGLAESRREGRWDIAPSKSAATCDSSDQNEGEKGDGNWKKETVRKRGAKEKTKKGRKAVEKRGRGERLSCSALCLSSL